MAERMVTRSFKVPSELWSTLQALAAEQQTTMGALVRDLLHAYADPDAPCTSCGDTPLSSFTVVGSSGLPVSSTRGTWSGEDAKNRIWEHCSDANGKVDVECVSRGFLYRDPSWPDDTREAYKLGIADIEDGQMRIFPDGVYTAAGGHGVATSDIPEDEKTRIKRKICDIYDRIDDSPECPFGHEVENAVKPNQFTLTGSTDLPIADRDATWDGSGAATRVFDQATDGDSVDTDAVARAFLYRDPDADPATKAAYSLGFADVVNGELQIIPKGVAATAGGRGVDATKGIPDEEKTKIKAKINTLYGKVRSKYDDWPENPYPDASGGDSSDEEPAPKEEQALMFAGIIVDEDGKPVLDDNGDPQPCSCDTDDEDYDADCQCEDDADDDGTPFPPEKQTAAIIGTGHLHSNSKDATTREAVARVMELLEDGAVGVSVAMDMDPDTMPDPDELEAAFADQDFDAVDALLADVKQRLRHLAIVDTAAFSDCRMTMDGDGNITGPMTYEGIWTGDARFTPFESVVWETTLPIPIIWDREEGDHTGMTIGSITSVTRAPGETASPHTNPEAVAAAAETSLLDNVPARYFATRQVTPDTPFTIAGPDSNGLRHVYGLAAPKGVCHRSGDGSQCFQYPGDVDPQKMRGFHTGTALTLDDGSAIRVGAITLGGMHVDTGLAARGVGITDISRYREDANQVFALVRAYETPYGLAVAGVVVPGVTEKQLAQARACAPSVELWPSGRGRTLAGIHLVPSPAWPVAASVGSAMEMHSTAPVVVEAAPPSVSYTATDITFTASEADRLTAIEASLSRMEKALALLATDAITDVPLPE